MVHRGMRSDAGRQLNSMLGFLMTVFACALVDIVKMARGFFSAGLQETLVSTIHRGSFALSRVNGQGWIRSGQLPTAESFVPDASDYGGMS